MFKSIRIYSIAPDWRAPTPAALEPALKKHAFSPLGATEKESVGWVSPRPQEYSPLIEAIGGQWIFKIQTERKSVPGGVLKKAVEARCKKIEEDTGRKVGRKEKKELKEEIELELLPRAFSKTGSTLVWLDPKNHRLVVGTSSQRAADDVVAKLIETTQDAGCIIPLTHLQTERSPSAAMSQWLLDKDAPAGFTLDRDLELKQLDEEKSVVRYARHNLEIDEVVEHIKAGKVPTQVAMTWDSRVSFVLCADLSIKKIELLEEVFSDMSEDDFGFDGDVTIATGELSKLLPDLVEALGGELRIEE
jgi:recombination associated protein RdgC